MLRAAIQYVTVTKSWHDRSPSTRERDRYVIMECFVATAEGGSVECLCALADQFKTPERLFKAAVAALRVGHLKCLQELARCHVPRIHIPFLSVVVSKTLFFPALARSLVLSMVAVRLDKLCLLLPLHLCQHDCLALGFQAHHVMKRSLSVVVVSELDCVLLTSQSHQ
jgi:hypothetical protein